MGLFGTHPWCKACGAVAAGCCATTSQGAGALLTASASGSEKKTRKPLVSPAQKEPASWLNDSESRFGKGWRGMDQIAIFIRGSRRGAKCLV